MLRLLALLGIGGCASGICDSCPAVSLTVNGKDAITAPAGTPLTYAWSSMNADSASSTVTVAPTSPDGCGNASGNPWVVDTVAGMTDPVALADCQAGFVYTLVVTVTQASTGDTASTSIVVTVPSASR